MKKLKAWHFVADDRTLGYGDGRETYEHPLGDFNMLDLTKPVQTVSGLPVRILCTDRVCDDLPVVGLVRRDGIDFVETWKLNGKYCDIKPHNLNLINVPQRHKHADLMIAYANNKNLQIQFRNPLVDDEWEETNHPEWRAHCEYRIKPENR